MNHGQLRKVYIMFGALLPMALPLSAGAQLSLPPVDDVLDRVPERPLKPLDERLEERKRRKVEPVEEEVVEEAEALTGEDPAGAAATLQGAAQTALPPAAGTVAGTTGQALGGLTGLLPALPRPFAADLGPAGWPVEKDVRIVLIRDNALPDTLAPGIEVLARRELASLDATLLTLRSADPLLLEAAIEAMSQTDPSLVSEFNYVYRFHSAQATEVAAEPADAVESAEAASTARPLKIGMIDSAVQEDHPLLRSSPVVSRDFVLSEGTRPRGHGTAVASLIAAQGSGAHILAASVFFQTPGYNPGAMTESLVAALDWLVSEEVDVINMSLAGPPDALLERMLSELGKPLVVAAVGNNGPSGEPLYPAAYDGVIGVTAVDRDKRIFHYANRGDHVDYAALGVNVQVADAGAGRRIESGTSMASPLVAVIIGSLLRQARLSPDELQSVLLESCEDLGRKGRDRIYGHGLLTAPPEFLTQNQKLAPTLTE